jgi:BASS family bile acid:Na+ symporter
VDSGIARDILLPMAIFLVVFGIGLELSVTDFVRVLRERRLLVMGTVIQVLVFPVITLLAVALLDLPEHLAGGFVLLAACPSGGFSNILTYLAGANLALSITLTTLSTLLAVVTMPAILLFARGGEVMAIPLEVVVGQLIATVALPVSAGITVRRLWPSLVRRYAKAYGNGTNVFIYVLVGWLFYQTGTALFAGFMHAFFVSLGLFVATMLPAQLLARAIGAGQDDAFTIAVEASIRNMGLATLIAFSTLGRPELVVAPTAYFFGCALLGLIAALAVKRSRTNITA